MLEDSNTRCVQINEDGERERRVWKRALEISLRRQSVRARRARGFAALKIRATLSKLLTTRWQILATGRRRCRGQRVTSALVQARPGAKHAEVLGQNREGQRERDAETQSDRDRGTERHHIQQAPAGGQNGHGTLGSGLTGIVASAAQEQHILAAPASDSIICGQQPGAHSAADWRWWEEEGRRASASLQHSHRLLRSCLSPVPNSPGSPTLHHSRGCRSEPTTARVHVVAHAHLTSLTRANAPK